MTDYFVQNPMTGDSFDPLLIIAIGLACLAALALLVFDKKR